MALKPKTCTKCGETKPITSFSNDASKRGGVRHSCRACDSIAAASRYAKNAEKVRARSAKWRADNPDKAKAYNVKWRDENRDRTKAIKTKWRVANSDYNAKWRAENPEARRLIAENRRARKAGGKLSNGLVRNLLKLQRGKCACGCKQALGDDYHLDHIMPLALGGTNTDDNMQLLTSKCNMQKSAKHPVDFMQQRGFLL